MNEPLPRRVLLLATFRVTAIIALLMAAYFYVPLHPESTVISAVTWATLLAMVIIIGIFSFQTRRINRSRYPLVAGVESLIVLIAIILIGFAFVYLVMSTSAPDTFSEPLTRTGAFYFAVTVLSTVGFGDITPRTDPSRWLVAIQMLLDIGVIAGAVRLLLSMARRADERQRATSDQA